jgi:eukaryotic-like serine/threonine-protein kinase
LANEPVVARPPSKLYRFQKLAQRNKLVFAAGGAVGVALIIGLAASTWEYLKERSAREQAIATSALFQQLLRSADPDGLKGSDYTVRQLLDDFSARLTNQLAGQVEATMRLAIGSTYQSLALLSPAEAHLRQAVALRTRALGPGNPDTLEAQDTLARLLVGFERKWEEGGRLSFETWQARLRLLGPEHRDTLRSRQTYAAALMEGGRAQEAEPIEREVLRVRERVLGPDDYDTIDSFGTLGQVLMARGASAEAELLFRKALTGLRRNGWADRQDGIICIKELAMARLEQGDPVEAEKLLEEVHPRAIQKLGPDHLLTLHIQRVLVRALAEQGRLDEAEALCRETLNARLHAKANQESYGTARTLLLLGRVLVEKGQLDEAEPHLQEALRVFREVAVNKPRPELAAQAANWLGAIQLARKDYPKAEALLLADSQQFLNPAAEMSPHERRQAVGHIIALYQARGKPEQAAAWRKKLDVLGTFGSSE